MNLENKIRIIMATKNIDNITELMKITNLSRNSINKLWHNENIASLKLETLITICDKLNIKLSDLIEYTPNASDQQKL